MASSNGTRTTQLRVPPPFVGRTVERAYLEAALQAAQDGDAGVVIVEGEAGVGKSRLMDELAELARRRSFQVLSGRCIEGGGIPYLPLTSALLPQLRRGSMLNSRVLGTGSGILASLAGEAATDSESLTATDHSRLAQALSRALIALAERRPLLFTIDDLQWADDDTLVAIEYLVFAVADEARRRPLNALMVLSSQPANTGRSARVLGRIAREGDVRQVKLHPLNEIEAHDLVTATVGASCSPGLLGELLSAGGGNPLLTIAILQEMSRAEALNVTGGFVEGTVPVQQISAPTAIQAAAERALQAQTPSRQTLLSELALLGADSDVEELVVASGRERSQVLDDVDGLVSGGLLARGGSRVSFAGSAVRRAAVDAVPLYRRQALNAEMGVRLFEAYGLAPLHILPLGRQILAAGSLVAPDVAMPVLEAAAARAQEIYAFGASAELYEAALEQDPGDSATDADAQVRRAHLHFECGRAFSRNGDYERARSHFAKAVDLFRASDCFDCWGEALASWGKQFTVAGRPIPDRQQFQDYIEAAGDRAPGARATVLAVWADSLWAERDVHDLEVAAMAASLASEAQDNLAGATANTSLGLARLRAMDPAGALAAFRESTRFAAGLASPTARAWGPVRAAMTNLVLGNLPDAAADARVGEECSRSGNDWANVAMALAIRVSVSALRGDFDAAETLASEASMALARSGYRPTSALLFPTLAWMRALRGRWDGALDAVSAWEAWGAGGTAVLLRDSIEAIRDPADSADRYAIHTGRAPWRRSLDLQAIGPIGALTILGHESGEPLPADFPFEWLERTWESGCQFSTSPPISVGRVLGIALARAGQGESGTARLRGAAEAAERCGARAEAALTRADLGLAIARSGGLAPPGEAIACLHQAISAFEELGMWGAKHALVRAAASAGITLPEEPRGPDYPDRLDEDDMSILEAFALGRDDAEAASDLLLDRRTVSRRQTTLLTRLGLASRADALSYLGDHGLEPAKRRRAPDRFDEPSGHVFLFTDINNSTPLNSALGDERYVRLLALHDRVIEEAVSACGGNVVKHTGDGYFVEFAGADAAVSCALAIQARFPLTLPESPDFAMTVGVGLHAGGAIERGFDFFGVAVIMASRICALAGGGEILASADVRATTSPGSAQFVDRGRFSLKGFSEQVRVYSVGAS